jgi:hypothetical protein
MNDQFEATKMTHSSVPSPLTSVANTLTNQQKAETIDYTADESMIAVSDAR